jgi:hypothetical protein
MSAPLASSLGLEPMVARNQDPKQTAFTVTCDAVAVAGSGVSAAARALSLRVLADPSSSAAQLSCPGHIFPLVARPGGVLERRSFVIGVIVVIIVVLKGAHRSLGRPMQARGAYTVRCHRGAHERRWLYESSAELLRVC